MRLPEGCTGFGLWFVVCGKKDMDFERRFEGFSVDADMFQNYVLGGPDSCFEDF